MTTMDRTGSLLGAYGLTDAHDRLLSADAPLAELQERCGGDLPGTLAIPELLALVQQARRIGLRLARAFSAFDGDAEVTGFARIHPLALDDGGGCEVVVENWQRSPLSPPNAREFAEKLDAIDRATAEVSARLDARQRVQVLSAHAPDAAALPTAALAAPGTVWSELVELIGITHLQPLHWRLIDGAEVTVAADVEGAHGGAGWAVAAVTLLAGVDDSVAAEGLTAGRLRIPSYK
jgi:hypothetical protein